jgi:hypothetical protein
MIMDKVVRMTSAITKLLSEEGSSMDSSVVMTDRCVIDAFVSNAQNPFLVSFPRTGSHWLRMLMELYFVRPSLVRVFYCHDKSDYLTLHTHDDDLNVVRDRVVYLYRDPVNTVFSQLKYYKEHEDNVARIAYWSDLYGRHLYKWLHEESFTMKKTIVRYEMLKKSLPEEFKLITEFFGEDLDLVRLHNASSRVTKQEVKRKTTDDEQVINLAADYGAERETFRQRHADLVWERLINNRSQLLGYFDYLEL